MNSRNRRAGKTHRGRAGVAMILALLCLVVFVSLAAAYASTANSNVLKSDNGRNVLDTRLTAESGLEFVAYHMLHADVPAGTSGQELLDALADSLGENLNGSADLGGAIVQHDDGDDMIVIPNITLPGTTRRFNATITLVDPNTPDLLAVRVNGTSDQATRTVGVQFQAASGSSGVFDFGIATRSVVDIQGNASIRGLHDPNESNILSTTTAQTGAIKLNGNMNLPGHVTASDPYYAADPNMAVKMTGNCTVGDPNKSYSHSTNPAVNPNIHVGGGYGEFPEVDPTVFEPFATNIVTSSTNTNGNLTFTNIRIRANANKTFNGNITIKGVVFVEKPNRVTFTGNLNMTGLIVTQDAGENQYNNNYIDFKGNCTFNGVEALPNQAPFQTLRTMKGSFLLAPGFGARFTGNFSSVNGCMAADAFSFTGNANATIKGGIINYSGSTFSLMGNSRLTIDRSTYDHIPPGFALPTKMVMKPGTYVEY